MLSARFYIKSKDGMQLIALKEFHFTEPPLQIALQLIDPYSVVSGVPPSSPPPLRTFEYKTHDQINDEYMYVHEVL